MGVCACPSKCSWHARKFPCEMADRPPLTCLMQTVLKEAMLCSMPGTLNAVCLCRLYHRAADPRAAQPAASFLRAACLEAINSICSCIH